MPGECAYEKVIYAVRVSFGNRDEFFLHGFLDEAVQALFVRDGIDSGSSVCVAVLEAHVEASLVTQK